MKKAVNQLKRSLFIGFILLSNHVFSMHEDQLVNLMSSLYLKQCNSVINDNLMVNKCLIVPNKDCGFWPNFETMIKEMKEMGHINALNLSIYWYLRQNSYQEGKPDNGDILGMWFGT
jgi:hypothetical protein